MKLYPTEVTLTNLTNAAHAINTAVDSERLLAKVTNMNPVVLASMNALIATLAGANVYYDANPGLNYLLLANITALTAGATRTNLLTLYPSLTEFAMYEQLNPGFWKMKTLGLGQRSAVWQTGMSAVTDWVSYVDLNS